MGKTIRQKTENTRRLLRNMNRTRKLERAARYHQAESYNTESRKVKEIVNAIHD